MGSAGFLVVIFILAVIAFIIIVVVVFYNKKEEKTRCYQSAANILKEKYLKDQLTNPEVATQSTLSIYDLRMMIFIKNLSSKPKKGYVFDAADGVKFGRKNSNNIILSEAIVSGDHCRIFSDINGRVYINDYSANGTMLKRGFSCVSVKSATFELMNGDIIIVGSAKFRIMLFWFDGKTV